MLVRSLSATLGGVLIHGRNVVPDFRRMVRIANIYGTNAGVVVSDEKHAVIENRSETLVRRMRSKHRSATAKISTGLWDCPGGNSKWFRFCRDVKYVKHLPTITALFYVIVRQPDHGQKILHFAVLLLCEFRQMHSKHRVCHVCAHVGR